MPLTDRFGEVILPILTPFDRDGAVDLPTMDRLLEHVFAHRLCDSLFVCGTTGEFQALSPDERVRVFTHVKATSGGRVPLIAGTGAVSTADAVHLTRQAERLGYDAVAVIVAHYSRPIQDEIYRYFVTVARSTGLPIIIYNIPLFTGVNLMPDTLARLAELPNIVGIKDEAGANPVQTSDYLRVAPRVTVYCGSDVMILPVLSQGGVGAVSGGAHVLGDLIKTMIGRFKAGAVAEATAIHHRIMPFHRALGTGGRTNPVPMIREAVRLATGIDVGPPRPPLMPPAVTETGPLRDALRAVGRLQQAADEPAPTR